MPLICRTMPHNTPPLGSQTLGDDSLCPPYKILRDLGGRGGGLYIKAGKGGGMGVCGTTSNDMKRGPYVGVGGMVAPQNNAVCLVLDRPLCLGVRKSQQWWTSFHWQSQHHNLLTEMSEQDTISFTKNNNSNLLEQLQSTH